MLSVLYCLEASLIISLGKFVLSILYINLLPILFKLILFYIYLTG
nr:MAG TPA: hypothetical protein [Caudoviricetes sp.]